MKTINRGWLKRKIQKGGVVKVESYSYDEMSGEQRSSAEMQVVYGGAFKEGTVTLSDWDFATKSGCAYQNEDGTITLIVHSNRSLTLRVPK